MNSLIYNIRPAISLIAIFTVITGLLYPALVTGIAGLVFPAQSSGSVIEKSGAAIGSSLIGQQFDSPNYFWGRLSATPEHPYNPALSSGSNYSAGHPALIEAARARILLLKKLDPENNNPIPADLITASASGLDPHISVEAASYQILRVAKARNLPLEALEKLIEKHTESRSLGLLGIPRVNVLQLNMALDEISASAQTEPEKP